MPFGWASDGIVARLVVPTAVLSVPSFFLNANCVIPSLNLVLNVSGFTGSSTIIVLFLSYNIKVTNLRIRCMRFGKYFLGDPPTISQQVFRVQRNLGFPSEPPLVQPLSLLRNLGAVSR